MTVFYLGKKGDLDRRRCQQPTNLLLKVIKKEVPNIHITKPERTNIIDFFKDLYIKYWANQKGKLVMNPDMDAAKLTLTILIYVQHLKTLTKISQKTYDNNAWSLETAQAELKAHNEEIFRI